jgi:ATP/maltotriose-dependent transcriptional regulator MalT
MLTAGLTISAESAHRTATRVRILNPSSGAFMAGSRSTFGKRQRERARQEKQAEKAQKKAQRKLQEQTSTERKDLVVTYDEEGRPQGFDFHDF